MSDMELHAPRWLGGNAPKPTATYRRWLETGGRMYWVETDKDGTLLLAEIKVKAHDKLETMRRLKHPATLARLQALVRPAPRCPHCGAVT